MFELLMLLLPLLLGGRLLSTIISRVAPMFLNYLKESGDRKKLRNYYRNFMQSPELFSALKPELAKFFDDKGWNICPCHNCQYMKKTIEKDDGSQANSAQAKISKAQTSVSSIDDIKKEKKSEST